MEQLFGMDSTIRYIYYTSVDGLGEMGTQNGTVSVIIILV